MSSTILLPDRDGAPAPYRMHEPRRWPRPAAPARTRIAYAAAHVVAAPLTDHAPAQPVALDWDASLAYRRHLWSYGLGVADAMDTAQRGMGLEWDVTRELVTRSAAEARACGGALVCGASTDQLPPGPHELAAVEAAYAEQVAFVEGAGAGVVLMASRQLAAAANGPDDYLRVYDRVLAQVSRPVILHWLGPMFDPALTGYWGHTDLDLAAQTLLALIREHAAVVDGVKVSLLDPLRERQLRVALPENVHLYTGDDFNYPELIEGDGARYSDALLGVFDAIAPVAATALAALDAGEVDSYRELLTATLPLARHLFAAPTYHYKTGLTFTAWIAGHQDAFTMVAGQQSARSLPHLCEVFRLADQAGLLPDPELAASRMRALLLVGGIEQ
jgi:hypothetical protein